MFLTTGSRHYIVIKCTNYKLFLAAGQIGQTNPQIMPRKKACTVCQTYTLFGHARTIVIVFGTHVSAFCQSVFLVPWYQTMIYVLKRELNYPLIRGDEMNYECAAEHGTWYNYSEKNWWSPGNFTQAVSFDLLSLRNICPENSRTHSHTHM